MVHNKSKSTSHAFALLDFDHAGVREEHHIVLNIFVVAALTGYEKVYVQFLSLLLFVCLLACLLFAGVPNAQNSIRA